MIYARQIRPECQESPLFLFDEWPEDMILTGNRRLNFHTTPLYDRFVDQWEMLYNALEDIRARNGWAVYGTATEAIMDYFPPEHKPKYSTRDIRMWKSILAEMCNKEENALICKALELMTGKTWGYTTLHGCCQGDWQNIIYCADNWSRETLREFEMEYFNMGSEWLIHDGTEAPETPEDIEGFTVYCATYDEDEIRRIIADAAGGNPEDVVMYAYDGDIVTAKYRIA